MTWVRHRPSPRRAPPDRAPDAGARPATDGGEAPLPPLPHERDEHAKPGPRTRAMQIAAEDLEEGRVDTECRGATPARACDGDVPALLKPPPERNDRRA